MMNYQEARSFIEEKQRYGGEMKLDGIRALIAEVGHPDEALTFIHIAGTNGKGSVLAYISTTLTRAGYRTGRYISPTLYSYRERIQVDEQPISREDFIRLTEELAGAVERLQRKGIPKPSPFELETVLGLLYFAEKKCDFVVLECGMGGRDDATNAICPDNKCLAVLTSVSLDHTEYLGDTYADIATVKAHIAAEGVPLVLAPQKICEVHVHDPAQTGIYDAVRRYCDEHHNPLILADLTQVQEHVDTLWEQSFVYKGERIVLHLAGAAQVENAITAYEALTYLTEHGIRGTKLTKTQILDGLAAARWNGRFTVLTKKPVFVVDGAHNPDAAEKLYRSIETYFSGRRVIFICGVLADKDYPAVLGRMLPLAEKVYTITPPDNPRGLPAADLARVIEGYGKPAQACESLEEARTRATKDALGTGEVTKEREGIVIAFGSLSFIGMLTQLVEKSGLTASKERTDA